jgi:uncharacterized protein (TIGR00369 family)
MKKVTAKQPNSADCFVCGLNNDKGLKAYFYETDTRELVAVFTPHRLHQSYPGRLHGGVAACILDETMGRAVQIGQPNVWGVTVELTVAYKKPLPYEAELKCVGRIVKESRLLFEAEGEIITPGGEVAATARGRYVKLPVERIAEGFGEGDDWKVHLDIDDPAEIDI